MKKGIHPNYHFVEVRLNNGETYKTRTTWGETGQQLTLDIDPTTHPAWTGGQQQLMDPRRPPDALQQEVRRHAEHARSQEVSAALIEFAAALQPEAGGPFALWSARTASITRSEMAAMLGAIFL